MRMTRTFLALAIALSSFTRLSRADDGPPSKPVDHRAANSIGASDAAGAAAAEEDSRVIQRRNVGAVGGSPRAVTASAQSSWVRTLLSLGGVTALILLLSWGYRAVTAGSALSARPKAPGMIQVLSRTTLSPRHSLVLVRIGPRMVLIGAAQDSLTTLHTIDDPDMVASLAGAGAASRPEAATIEFRSALESAAREFDAVENAPIPPSESSSGAVAARRMVDAIRPRRASSAGV